MLQNICKTRVEDRRWLHVKENILRPQPREVDSSETFLQMFYFTCNHCQSSSRVRSC